MSFLITVRVAGVMGIDDAESLCGDLRRTTGLDWRADHAGDEGKLNAAVTDVFHAAVGGLTGKALEIAARVAVARTREVVGRWRDRRLDPPPVEIAVEEAPGPARQDVAPAGQPGD